MLYERTKNKAKDSGISMDGQTVKASLFLSLKAKDRPFAKGRYGAAIILIRGGYDYELF